MDLTQDTGPRTGHPIHIPRRYLHKPERRPGYQFSGEGSVFGRVLAKHASTTKETASFVPAMETIALSHPTHAEIEETLAQTCNNELQMTGAV